MAWIRSDTPPTEAGYYLTVYLNHEEEQHMVKAFWYNTEKGKWIFRFEPEVHLWWDVRHDFYSPCQLQENVGGLPEGFHLISKQ